MQSDPPKIEFPCDYPIKVLALSAGDLAEAILAVFERHAPGFDRAAVTARASSKGTFTAITITITATGPDQLEALHQDLLGTGRGTGHLMAIPGVVRRELGLVDYEPTLQAMKDLTDTRTGDDPDQLWLLQHPRVFTQGQAGKAEHVLAPGDIPVIQVDRGGQVTYHGPGQWVLYLMIDLRRRSWGVRDLVNMIERSIVVLLAGYGIDAAPKPEAPGVYVAGAKIASLGLRVRRGCSYHGLSLNVDMDLEPFERINPCGHRGLQVTSMARLLPGGTVDMEIVGRRLLATVAAQLESC